MKLRKNSLFIRFLVYYIRKQLRNSLVEEMHRERHVKRGTEVPCLLLGHLPPSFSVFSATQALPEPHSSGNFMQISSVGIINY